MVRIGFVKKRTGLTPSTTAAPTPGETPCSDAVLTPTPWHAQLPPTTDRTVEDREDDDMESDQSEISDLTEESEESMPPITRHTVRALPLSTTSDLQQELAGTPRAFPEVLREAGWVAGGAPDVAAAPSLTWPDTDSFKGFPATASSSSAAAAPAPAIPPPAPAPARLPRLPIVPSWASPAFALLRSADIQGADLTMGLAFRATWRPDSAALVHPSFAGVGGGAPRGAPSSALDITAVSSHSPMVVQPLQVLLRHAQQVTGEGQVTFNFMSSPVPPLHPRIISSIVNELAESMDIVRSGRPEGQCPPAQWGNLAASRAAVLALRLVAVLWGNDARDEQAAREIRDPSQRAVPPSPMYEEMLLRERLVRWLSYPSSITGAIASTPDSLLLCGRVTEGAKALRSQGNLIESMLVLAGRTSFASSAPEGISSAKQTRELVYRGNQQLTTPSRALDMTTPEGRTEGSIPDWRRRLQCHLSQEGGVPLKQSVANFLLTVGSTPPVYHEAFRTAKAEWKETDDVPVPEGNHRDICSHILDLWIQGMGTPEVVEGLLNPYSWHVSPFNYALNWILCLLMRHVLSVPQDLMSALTRTYAGQLCMEGLWKWAVFVLLTLPDPVARREQVVRVLSRHTAELPTPAKAPTTPFPLPTGAISLPTAWINAAISATKPAPPPASPRRPAHRCALESTLTIQEYTTNLLAAIHID